MFYGAVDNSSNTTPEYIAHPFGGDIHSKQHNAYLSLRNALTANCTRWEMSDEVANNVLTKVEALKKELKLREYRKVLVAFINYLDSNQCPVRRYTKRNLFGFIPWGMQKTPEFERLYDTLREEATWARDRLEEETEKAFNKKLGKMNGSSRSRRTSVNWNTAARLLILAGMASRAAAQSISGFTVMSIDDNGLVAAAHFQQVADGTTQLWFTTFDGSNGFNPTLLDERCIDFGIETAGDNALIQSDPHNPFSVNTLFSSTGMNVPTRLQQTPVDLSNPRNLAIGSTTEIASPDDTPFSANDDLLAIPTSTGIDVEFLRGGGSPLTLTRPNYSPSGTTPTIGTFPHGQLHMTLVPIMSSGPGGIPQPGQQLMCFDAAGNVEIGDIIHPTPHSANVVQGKVVAHAGTGNELTVVILAEDGSIVSFKVDTDCKARDDKALMPVSGVYAGQRAPFSVVVTDSESIVVHAYNEHGIVTQHCFNPDGNRVGPEAGVPALPSDAYNHLNLYKFTSTLTKDGNFIFVPNPRDDQLYVLSGGCFATDTRELNFDDGDAPEILITEKHFQFVDSQTGELSNKAQIKLTGSGFDVEVGGETRANRIFTVREQNDEKVKARITAQEGNVKATISASLDGKHWSTEQPLTLKREGQRVPWEPIVFGSIGGVVFVVAAIVGGVYARKRCARRARGDEERQFLQHQQHQQQRQRPGAAAAVELAAVSAASSASASSSGQHQPPRQPPAYAGPEPSGGGGGAAGSGGDGSGGGGAAGDEALDEVVVAVDEERQAIDPLGGQRAEVQASNADDNGPGAGGGSGSAAGGDGDVELQAAVIAADEQRHEETLAAEVLASGVDGGGAGSGSNSGSSSAGNDDGSGDDEAEAMDARVGASSGGSLVLDVATVASASLEQTGLFASHSSHASGAGGEAALAVTTIADDVDAGEATPQIWQEAMDFHQQTAAAASYDEAPPVYVEDESGYTEIPAGDGSNTTVFFCQATGRRVTPADLDEYLTLRFQRLDMSKLLDRLQVAMQQCKTGKHHQTNRGLEDEEILYEQKVQHLATLELEEKVRTYCQHTPHTALLNRLDIARTHCKTRRHHTERRKLNNAELLLERTLKIVIKGFLEDQLKKQCAEMQVEKLVEAAARQRTNLLTTSEGTTRHWYAETAISLLQDESTRRSEAAAERRCVTPGPQQISGDLTPVATSPARSLLGTPPMAGLVR